MPESTDSLQRLLEVYMLVKKEDLDIAQGVADPGWGFPGGGHGPP
jgi:hypothetical protein